MKTERQGEVYVIRNLLNDKEYVGQTVRSTYVRVLEHIKQAFVYNNQKPLYKAMRRDQWKNFNVDVLWCGPESKLNAAEIHFVRQRKTFIDWGMGYNLTTGGGQCKVSKYTIRKLRRAMRKRVAVHPAWFAYLAALMQTPEARMKNAQALRLYAELKRMAGEPHFSQKAMKLFGHYNHVSGIFKHSVNTRRRMSETHTKRFSDPAVRAKFKRALSKRSVRARMSQAALDRWALPGVKERASAAQLKRWSDPLAREAKSKSTIAQWAKRRALTP